MRILLSLFFTVSSFVAFGQSFDNIRKSKLYLTDTLQIDTLSLVPKTLVLSTINGVIIPSEYYVVNYPLALLILKKTKLRSDSLFNSTLNDSLLVSYRVFPYDFNKTFQFKNFNALKSFSNPLNPFAIGYQPTDQNIDLFKSQGLNKSGSISRGVMFGNNQDLSVNSNLNLNLSGKISDKFSILAAITDNNIPIQPEGNTQQLQSFDQVYIQLFDDQTKITAGDFQLSRPNSYFMNFYKRAQGGSVTTSFNPSKWASSPQKINMAASAAVSKGKFSRYLVQGVEGNQGPYRLKGAENELFIVVLSGTEKVFIDGRQLIRGQENDYVIDYNTSEITFTAKQLITKDKRIIVEFQYSDKNYARSLFFYNTEYEDDNLKLRFNVYSEQDAKNQSLQQELSPEKKLLLASIGDSINQAVFLAADSVPYTANEVLYKRIDTLAGGVLYDSVFVRSASPDSAFYRLSFSLVGQGRGNYKQQLNTANGKVFEWVAPLDGVKQGSYEPLVLLVTPKKRQMITLGGDYRLNKNTKTNFELAYGNYDVNTFSEQGNADNGTYAIKGGIENTKPLSSMEGMPWLMTSFFNYEQLNKNFNYIERFRSIEFERDWNIINKKIIPAQFLTSSGLGFSKKDITRVNYEVQTFNAQTDYAGIKNALNASFTKNKYDFSITGSYLNAKSTTDNSNFFRQKAKLTKKLPLFTIGLWQDQEINKRQQAKDSLLANSYQYLEWEAFLSNPDSFVNLFNLSYKQRYDKLPSNNKLLQATYGESYAASFGLLKNQNSTLVTSSTFRKLSITNSDLTLFKPENTLLNRVEYNLKVGKGTFVSSTFYEVGSGLELKKEFSFLEVPAGQGVYAYVGDLNRNELRDLNEFEVAPLPDMARFIKVFTPTNDYVKVYTNQFNQVFNLYPERIWGNKMGVKKTISRFSNQTAYRIDRKTNREDFASALNPFAFNNDSALVSINASFRNTLFFNRTNAKFGLDYSWNDNRNKTLLINGFEIRQNNFQSLRLRLNLSSFMLFNLNATKGLKTNLSALFSNRNFFISYGDIEPKLSFQKGTSFRISILYKLAHKKNDLVYGGETLSGQTIGTEIKYNVLAKGNLLFNLNYVLNTFSAFQKSLLSFEMLEGLQPGRNVTWSLSYNRSLSNNTQLTVNYSGRASANSPAVHTGGVQVRAFF